MSSLRRSAIAIAIALTLAACGGSEQAAPAPAPAPIPAPAPRPAPAPKPPADCLAVGQTMAEGILTGETAAGPVSAVRASAFRSPDFENVYFIAVEFTLSGAENVVGVWASNSLERGGGIILSADAFAKEFSDWPDAETTSAAISPADPSIRKARDCVEATEAY